MLDVIDNRYTEAITLRTLSTSVGRQPAYLGRLFRQEVGSSFHDYLTRVRMEHAAELIREGVKIEAVALCVGYRSKKNFYQQFRRQFATTPVPYRCRTLATAPPDDRATFTSDAERPAIAEDRPGARMMHDTRAVPMPRSMTPDVEPSLRSLSSIFRATNRAWRLAVRAQELLLQNFGRLRMGILLTDHTGRYIIANRAALDVTGYSTTELRTLSPAELFVQGPSADTRCVWQFLLTRPRRPDRCPNATVRTKTGDAVSLYVVTLRNLLTDHHGAATLDGLPASAR